MCHEQKIATFTKSKLMHVVRVRSEEENLNFRDVCMHRISTTGFIFHIKREVIHFKVLIKRECMKYCITFGRVLVLMKRLALHLHVLLIFKGGVSKQIR